MSDDWRLDNPSSTHYLETAEKSIPWRFALIAAT
jgi:hypothetical protein